MKSAKRGKAFYAVIDLDATYMGPMEFCNGGLKENSLALWHGDCGTLFHTYERARSAIRTSRRYAKRERMPWTLSLKIIRLYVDARGSR